MNIRGFSHEQISKLAMLMKKAYIPGISVAAVVDGKPSSYSTIGFAEIKSKDPVPVTETTLFEAASLSKLPFAYLVLKLVMEDKLDLDQPLYTVLSASEYKRFDDNAWSRKVTARLILSHQSGLPHWMPNKKLVFLFEPGTGYSYSSEGYLYLQKVLEKLTNMSLEKLAKQNVFDPLKMHHSFYSKPSAAQSRAAQHDEWGNTILFPNEEPENAAGSLHTTAEDYAKFIAAWIKEIVPWLKLKNTNTALVSMTKDAAALGSIGWGLGWGFQQTKQGTLIFQWGDCDYSKGFAAINLNNNSAVVYFANSNTGLAIAKEVIETANPLLGDLTPALRYIFTMDNYDRYDMPGWEERHLALANAREAEIQGKYSLAMTYLQKALEYKQNDMVAVNRLEQLKAMTNPVLLSEEAIRRYTGIYEIGERIPPDYVKLTLKDNKLYISIQSMSEYKDIELTPRSNTNFFNLKMNIEISFTTNTQFTMWGYNASKMPSSTKHTFVQLDITTRDTQAALPHPQQNTNIQKGPDKQPVQDRTTSFIDGKSTHRKSGP